MFMLCYERGKACKELYIVKKRKRREPGCAWLTEASTQNIL